MSPAAGSMLLAVALSLLLGAPPEPDRALTSPPADEVRADSVRTVREMRAAQARFERFRLSNMPWVNDRWGGDCDERIGRFCLWHGGRGDDEWDPPEDPEPVVRERDTLIRTLIDAWAQHPGDAWLNGQLVHYLLDADRASTAAEVARGCAAEPWWCAALLGYAEHAAADYAAAEQAFDEALAALPEEEAERWRDLTTLLDPADRRSYRRLEGDEREAFERTFWWLADPFHSMAGNDRRTEHLSRLVQARIHGESRATDGTAWGRDVEELLLRYGHPVAWERVRPRTPTLSHGTSVVSRYPPRRRELLPAAGFVSEPLTLNGDAWQLDERVIRTGYDPPWARHFDHLDYEPYAFRRGDSLLVVTSFEVPADTAGVQAGWRVSVTAATGPDDEPVLATRELSEGWHAVALTLPAAEGVFSVEALREDSVRAGRARFGARSPPLTPTGAGVSDLLLLEPDDPLPEVLEEAVERLLPPGPLHAGTDVAVFWEIHGVEGRRIPIRTRIGIVPEETGWLRRMGEAIGVLPRRYPLRIQWEEETSGERGPFARSVRVRIPDLPAGRYRIELVARMPEGDPIEVSRPVVIAPPDETSR